MANRVPITVRIESFEGPLDLLLYLIQSHEMDISRISISRITDQYLGYVRLMQELNFDVASEFLVMAATLLHWKSKAILPQEPKADGSAAGAEEGELSQDDLIRQLQEHQRFMQAGETLAQLPLLGEDVFARPNRKPPIERVWKELSLTRLTLAYQEMLVRNRKRTTVLRKETVSLQSKIAEFKDRLEVGRIIGMRELLSSQPDRPEIVATFLASLELSRLRKMRLFQEKTYEEIYIELLESLRNFDESAVSGFDNPAPASAKTPSGAPEPEESGEVAYEGATVDDRRAAMDLSGVVEFTPIAQLTAELANAKAESVPEPVE